MQEPLEAPEELPAREAGGGRGNGGPINLDPSATTQPKNNPLPVNILPTPAPHATPKAPTIKATLSLLALQNLKKLVDTVQTFATTSKTLAATHIAWHSGWFGCGFGFGAPEPRHC